MKKMFLAVVVIYSCIGLVMAQDNPCGEKKTSQEVTEGISIYGDPAKPIEVLMGQKFAITLHANATTGYRWQLAKPLDNSIVEHLGNEYLKPRTRLVGAGGKEVWKFKALGRGKTIIAMKYIRPWEKDIPPVENVQFQIVVH